MGGDRYHDQTRECIGCGTEYNWSAGEQERFHRFSLADPPQRCEDCRQVTWKSLGAAAGGGSDDAGPHAA